MNDRWPKPVSLQRKTRTKQRGAKTLRPEALNKMIQALRDGDETEQYKSKEDKIRDYLSEFPSYGFSPSILNIIINTEVDIWFAVLFTDKTQQHKHTRIEVARNPFEKAVSISGSTKKNETQTWIVRGIIGPFETQEEAKKTTDAWKVQKNKRLEAGANLAETMKKKFYYGCIGDLQSS